LQTNSVRNNSIPRGDFHQFGNNLSKGGRKRVCIELCKLGMRIQGFLVNNLNDARQRL
jgi:hypothetical protein